MLAFIILGSIIFFAGSMMNKRNPQFQQFALGVKGIGVALVFLGLLFKSVRQIDPGTVGVKTLFGKVDNEPLGSGLHLVNPFLEITPFTIKTQNYTMSGVSSEGDINGDDAIRVLTADGLEVILDLTVLYKIIPTEAPRILRQIGSDYKDVVIRPVSRTKIRDNAVYYEAVALYSAKREEFQIRIFESIEDDFKKRGIELENLLIRNITLPKSVKLTIESKINAEQDAQKMQFVLLKEKQEAERKRIEAAGIADYQRIINSSLTDRQLQYEQIKAMKELSLSPNSKVVISGTKSQVPIILNDK